MVGLAHHHRSGVDPLDHWIEHARIETSRFLPREDCRLRPSATNKRHLRRCGERKEGLQVSSIQNGAMHLAFQLIAGKIVKKNRPMQVTSFIVDLAGKCVEGM